MNHAVNKKKLHISTDSADIFKKYLNGELNASEAHHFERHLLNDAFENDALEGISSIDADTLEHDLKTLRSKIETRSRSRWLRPVLYAAASIAITVGILTTLWQLQPEQLPTVSDNVEIKPTPTPKKEHAPEAIEEKIPLEFSAPIPKKETAKTRPIKRSAKIDKKYDAPQTTKQLATPLEKNVDFSLADNEALKINIPQSDAPKSRLENEVMNVDYGTLEGINIEGMSGYDTDQKLFIKGRITDRNRHPLPGASINVEGTNLATVANLDGSYEMEIPAKDSSKSIRVDFVGFVAQESNILPNDSLNFVLNEEILALSELVTVSSSEKSKRAISENIDAQPEVGMEAYIAELEKNLRYPSNGSGKKELVVALVTINYRGEIRNIEVKRSPGEDYSIETVRVIRNGSKWLPATNKGFPIEDTVKIKINFHPN